MNSIRRYTALLKNPHFWYITIIMAGCSAFYYAPSIIDFMGWPKVRWDALYYGVHDPHRALFLIPVLYAAYRFRVRGAIATTLISMAVFLPRALFISPYADSLIRAMAFVGVIGAIGILAAKLFDSIAGHKQAEAEANKLKEKYEVLVNNIPEVIYSCLPDKNAAMLFISDRFGDWTGYYPDDFYRDAKTWPNCIHPEDKDRAIAGYVETFSQNKAVDLEYRVVHKDTGQVRYIRDYGAPVFDDDGSIHHYDGILSDITKRKRAEEKLEQERRLFIGGPTVVFRWIVADGWPIDYASPNVYGLLGYTAEELMDGRHLFGDMLHPDDVPRIVEENKRAEGRADCEQLVTEYRILDKDGKIRWVHEHTSLIRDGEGQVKYHHGYVTDITEHKLAEQALQESKAQYQDLFDNANDLIQSVGPSGHFLYTNKTWQKILGYSEEEVSNLTIRDVIHPDSLAHCMEVFREVMSGGTLSNVEAVFVTRDGKPVLVEGNANCRFEEGKPVATRSIFRDITERKQAEETLRKSEARYRELANSLPQIVFETDENGRLTFVNQAAFTSMGYSKDDLDKGLNALQMIVPYERDQAGENIRRILNGEEPDYRDFTLQRVDGSTFPAIIHSKRILLGDKVAGLRGIITDITESKQAEELLRESEHRLRSILDSVQAGVIIIDEETHTILNVNPYAAEIIGAGRDEIIGHVCHRFICPAMEGKCPVSDLGQTVDNAEVELLNARGETIPILKTVTKIVLGKRRCIMDSFIDITERKLAEEKIKASLAEKELLLKEVHHRVKNNMQIISSLLKLGAGAVKNKEDAAVFKDSQDQIKSMALVYNKLYQAKDLAHIDFREYVRELVSGLAHSYKAVSGKVTTSVEGGDVPLGVDLAIPCGLVINELITNSLKYAFPKGRGGEIRVSIGESEGEVELTVSDDGVGIPASLDLARSKTLGLHLVGNLVEQLGGKIELDRTAGTRFRITFSKKQE